MEGRDMSGEPEDDLITEQERKQLLAALHTRLFWVGKEIPYNCDIRGKICNLHNIVWELLQKERLDEEDRKLINKCILYIDEKAKEDELELSTGQLTREEADRLFDETAGLMRTLMNLRDIEEGKSKEKERQFHETYSRERVAEARRWLNLLRDTGELK
ncbi:methyl-accepting chemotaxis protein [Methanolobus chelungpuianus]|uniref:Methyl-accepting chemotaxis protein n=2 Tax=Methanolobus chelungpuianus TaxID=502115 RepID=A0AAE3KXL0_9EURY|nr:methyl-accepting chemotaxis protein [Methanolobus chelungpuianus]